MNPLIRRLRDSDLFGLRETLENLKPVGDLSGEELQKIYWEIAANPRHMIFVAELDGQIVGTTTLFNEKKFIHRGGLVGHLEDVAVRRGFRGRGIGQSLVRHASVEAARAGGYKAILNCAEDEVPFYEKCGFRKHEVEMRLDLV